MIGGRTDGGHGDIRQWLRDLCPGVWDASSAGGGISDFIVKTHRGTVVFVEAKNPKMPPSARRLTPKQQKFAVLMGDSFVVAMTIEDCVRISKM